MKVIFLYHHGGHFPYKLSKFSYEGHFLLGHFPFRSFSWSSFLNVPSYILDKKIEDFHRGDPYVQWRPMKVETTGATLPL